MRNKKYRPIKIWLILILLVLIMIPISLFLMSGWEKYVVLLCGIGTLTILIICLTYWFEVKEDKILIRHSLSSFNKQYRSIFKTRVILIDDINSIDIRDSGKTIIINLKNTNSLCLQIGGYFDRLEIVQLFYEVKKQIN